MHHYAPHVAFAAAAGPAGNLQLLDLRHLRHQTLADPELERVVLDLFLNEAPRYAADISAAADAAAWRMAVHTLKGVALNIGAFRLAQVCRQHEGVWQCAYAPAACEAVREIVAMIEATVAAICEVQAAA